MIEALRAITLTIRSQGGTPVAELEWRDGATKVLFATETLRPAAQRWLEHGLTEWVGTGDEAVPRSTPSRSPEFLPRLEEYLAGQFRFRITCKKVVEQVPYATVVIAESLERDEWFAAMGGVVLQSIATGATTLPATLGMLSGGSMTVLPPWGGAHAQVVGSATGQMLFRRARREGLTPATTGLTAHRPS